MADIDASAGKSCVGPFFFPSSAKSRETRAFHSFRSPIFCSLPVCYFSSPSNLRLFLLFSFPFSV